MAALVIAVMAIVVLLGAAHLFKVLFLPLKLIKRVALLFFALGAVGVKHILSPIFVLENLLFVVILLTRLLILLGFLCLLVEAL